MMTFPFLAAWVVWLASLAAPVYAADDFLPPDQAFRLEARVADAGRLEVAYQVAPGYYLYRERFAVAAVPAAVSLGEAVYPPGKVKFDETFQKDVETLRDRVIVTVPVTAAPAEFRLDVTSQGCADKGLCYPPQVQALRVSVADGALQAVALMNEREAESWQPPATAAMPLAAGPAPVTTAGSTSSTPTALAGIDAALRSGRSITVIGVFLLAGLLLSFTPCVLPMVPILSSIIVGQGAPVSRLRGFTLSVAYALGMALVYTALGIGAGLAGEGLAALLQTPAVLTTFAVLLGVLSLSMFGVYELQVPVALQSRLAARSGRLPGGRHGGVMLMGGLSALIVGPCVAAPLAGALLYISQTRDVVLGGTALFALACGMSVPLLLVGLSAGSLLPRAGAWMEAVKRCFGVLLLGVALWMVSPVLSITAQMLGWGALLLGCGVFLRAFDRLPDGAAGISRLFKALGVVLALLGAAQVVGAVSGGQSVLQPLAHWRAGGDGAGSGAVGSSATGPVRFQRVRSVAELDAAVRSAGRPVMLDFYADWCVACKEFEAFTFPDPRVRERLAGALLLQADVTANNADDRALLKRFALFGPPGIIFFDRQGAEQPAARVIGFQNAADFLVSLDAAGL